MREYQLNIAKKSVSIQADIAFRYVFIYSHTFSFAAVDSKTSSRARDRKRVYTQNSKMAAQNDRMTTNFKPLSQKLAITEPLFCK